MPDEPEDVPGPAPLPDAAAPAKKAPARNAVKRAVPATKAGAGSPAPPARPGKRTAAPRRTAAPADAPPSEPWPSRPSAAPPTQPRRSVDVPALPAAAPPAPIVTDPTTVDRPRDGVLRALVALAVLLLAAAAGLGTAALVEHRDTSYRTTVVVQIAQGSQPTQPAGLLIGLAVHTYAATAATHAFTLDAAKRASTHAVRDVTTAPRGSDQLVLTVAADTAEHARALAAGAGDALVEAVNLSEAVNQPSAGDRLLANVLPTPPVVTRHAPAIGRVWLLGLAAAAAVLALAGATALIRRR